MTVKKRLFISNILMLIMPILITALISAGCVVTIWSVFTHNKGIGFEDSEDFYVASAGISKYAIEALQLGPDERTDKLNTLSNILDRASMSLNVTSNGASIYSYGQSDEKDPLLLEAVKLLGDEGTASAGERCLCSHTISANGKEYHIYIYGNQAELSYSTLKTVIALAAGVLIITIILAIWLTNRFLIKFVFKKIEQPLNTLTDGVRQIRDGNLGFRIEYDEMDEFAPVCADFNEMAMRLKASIDLIQQHEQSRKELMAGISHDLLTPLTSIQAYVEGLLDGVAKTPEMQEIYLKTIKSKAEDITRMVKQIFMFSKLELGEDPDNPVILNLASVITELIQTVKNEYSEKGLIINTDLEPVLAFIDPEQLQRVLVNIMENSLKYKNKENGELQISLKKTDAGCILILLDDGPGVPDDELNRLFDVFYRIDPARQNPNKGSGLGLSIAERTVHRMNGKISAQNAENGGLKIIIELPEAGK